MGTIRSDLKELWKLQGHQCQHQEPIQLSPLLLEKPLSEWPVPQFINLFLPEFPMRPIRGQQRLKILGLVAKGSFGTVLKVLDCAQKAVFAVKVVPKVKVLQRDTLRQCKEEVSIQCNTKVNPEEKVAISGQHTPGPEWDISQHISVCSLLVCWFRDYQRQINHPFVYTLGDSWQGKRHLFIMCSYCCTDLYSLWSAVGCFPEASVCLFAAELVLVLCYLHDLGIIHRDIKMENILLDERGHLKLTDLGLSRHLSQGARAYTICGTLQYMAPEVLSGGPYNHTADWWSLGVLLPGNWKAERDHVSMLASVTLCVSETPATMNQELSLLLHGISFLSSWYPMSLPHPEQTAVVPEPSPPSTFYLHHFQIHPFFRGVAFDPELLQKPPVNFVMETQDTRPNPLESVPFKDFDCDLESFLVHSISALPSLQVD